MSSSLATPKSVPAVIIGIHRSTALALAPIFDNTPYYVAAVLDLHESPKLYQYSQQNLGAVLHALHPRPQIVISGTAVEQIVPEVQAVWSAYSEKMLKGGKGVYVALSDFHSEDAPPPPGVNKYLMKRLDGVFRLGS